MNLQYTVVLRTCLAPETWGDKINITMALPRDKLFTEFYSITLRNTDVIRNDSSDH